LGNFTLSNKKTPFLKGVIAVCLGKFFQKRSLKDCFSINALNDLKLKESLNANNR